MQILVLGMPESAAEFGKKFTAGHKYVYIQSYNELEKHLPQTDVVFDFLLQDNPERLVHYANKTNLTVFCHVVKTQMAALTQNAGNMGCTLFGFNGMPTMINRQYLEVSVLNAACEAKLQAICKELGTEFLIVEDRVGMVTPRIICMIINEACYTLQEGTASIKDIDLGMKLGTNYPHGPFEWADMMGTKNVYELLQAIYHDTKDERYKICPLLKTKYLKNEPFLAE